MVVPVPLEVISMLQMFKDYAEKGNESERSPLLEMLMPHFEEIFDEIDVETVDLTESLKKSDTIKSQYQAENHGNQSSRIQYCIQGVVTVSEGQNNFSPDIVTGVRTVTAIIIEWKSSPTGKQNT
jgi:hypothetical protein